MITIGRLRQAGGNNLTSRYLSLAGNSTREDAESSVDKHASDAVREPRLAVKSPGRSRERQRRPRRG